MLADEYGAEHAGCCMSATLRDYGRIGLLALRKGVLADSTRFCPSWMKDATTPSPSMPGYGYQWWLIGPGRLRRARHFRSVDRDLRPQNIVIVTHGLWPSAQSKELSEFRRAFHEAVRDVGR